MLVYIYIVCLTISRHDDEGSLFPFSTLLKPLSMAKGLLITANECNSG